MASRSRKRRLSPKSRRALALLANSPFGATEALLFALGFTRRMLAGLVNQGLATRHHTTVRAGGRVIAATYMRITDAGRQAVKEASRH